MFVNRYDKNNKKKNIVFKHKGYVLSGSTNTLNRQERVGEYEETVTVPVQRYADSLRRKHFDDESLQ